MITKIKKKRNKKRNALIFSIIVGSLVLLIAGFLIFTNINIARRRAELTERAEALRKEIQILEQKNQELQAKIAQAEDPDFKRRKLREEFGYGRPGEEKVVILPIEEDIEEPVEEEKSFWQKIWEWFGF